VLLRAIERLETRQQLAERMLLELLEKEAAPAPRQAAQRQAAQTSRKKKSQPLQRKVAHVQDIPSAYRALLDALRF
jgi:hypothetical protein